MACEGRKGEEFVKKVGTHGKHYNWYREKAVQALGRMEENMKKGPQLEGIRLWDMPEYQQRNEIKEI